MTLESGDIVDRYEGRMPWKETCPMDQRMQFVIEHRSSTLTWVVA